jgi:putative drug exporter of the RND superfamily
VLIGGTSAENYDTTETLRSDAKLIVPLILALIALILAALLRAIVAPLYLVATVVLSYAFAIGASTLIFTEIFNQPDGDPGLPTFAFIFLVALGVDYNIFLISRIREESELREVHDAVITGLERTGGVITSAGLILAGTFCALMALPLESLFQIGFTVALGLLVDTFLVRTVLVPSIAFLLGDRNWWPGGRSTMPIGPAREEF